MKSNNRKPLANKKGGRPVWFNILAATGISILVFFVFFFMLDMITRHGKYLRVPDVKGKSLPDAVKFLEDAGFEVIVQDSVYYDTIPALTILKQFPDPDATVKVNRTIYLTVNRLIAPVISMPNLLGMSFRNAEMELRTRGLKLGDTTFVPDIARNAVKDQLVNGVSIRPGSDVPMGSIVSLVLGAGIGSEDMPVPDLFGMTYDEAKAMMEASGINLGVVLLDPDVTDTIAGFVYWQNPDPVSEDFRTNKIRAGQMIDIRLSLIKPERADSTAEIKVEGDLR
jgi:beta-lactam-binding protein with PASTA domain